jgi:hypothetical protein
MGRQLPAGQLIRDQIDLYMPAGSINRVVGESYQSLQLSVFADNGLIAWPLADGSTVADSSVSAGTVYFNQIAGAPGYYAVRFFPDRVGFWRLVFREPTLNEEVILSYDVAPARPGVASNELNASFVPQP